MYVGSETRSLSEIISDTNILGIIAIIIVMITVYILPIVMACRYKCNNRKLIIIIHIVLTLIGCIFGLPLGSIVSFIMIAVNKKKSQFYENTGKNIAWLHVVLYVCSILALFTPVIKVKSSEDMGLTGITNFNFIFFMRNDELGYLLNEDAMRLTKALLLVIIGIFILGLVLNLIFRDARKLIGINAFLQWINASIMTAFETPFTSYVTEPGTAFILEGLITTVFVVSLYVVVFKTSYVDN